MSGSLGTGPCARGTTAARIDLPPAVDVLAPAAAGCDSAITTTKALNTLAMRARAELGYRLVSSDMPHFLALPHLLTGEHNNPNPLREVARAIEA